MQHSETVRYAFTAGGRQYEVEGVFGHGTRWVVNGPPLHAGVAGRSVDTVLHDVLDEPGLMVQLRKTHGSISDVRRA